MQKTILSENGHFYIHYDTSGTEAPDLADTNDDGIPDYINAVALAADSSYTILVETMDFIDGANGDDNITDIFVLELGGSAYGWTRKMDSNCDESCIEIDNDFSESNYFTNGIPAMQVTLVHEYFHTIQLDYRCNFGFNSYFYELTSTWIEDVTFPEVDDYLNFMTESVQSSNYYKNPELDFDNTNGYSVAWFGHFLSTQYDELGGITHLEELESVIMRKIWERIGNTGSSALNVIDYILNYEYNSSFIEAWVDFNSRNLFNQLDESLYYYQDQSMIGPIITSESIEIEETIFSNNYILTNNSVKIPSFTIYQQGIVDIIISSSNGDYSGYVAVISDTEGNLNPIFLGKTDIISEDEKIYFIMNSENSSLTVNLSLTPDYTPLPPLKVWALTAPDFVDLWWDPSPGPGDTLWYVIFRDGEILYSTSDTLYTDESVNNNTAYEYSIVASSNIGESEPISISTNTAEPDYPAEPEDFLFLPDWDKVNLWWDISKGPGISIAYIIYRNEDSLTTLEDTSYIDNNVLPNESYQYELFASNRIGKSIQPAINKVMTWPSPEAIKRTELLIVYPNPIKTYSSTGFSV